MTQHKSSFRRSLQSALKHKRVANEILDSIKLSQDSLNGALDKLDADSAGSLDTNYSSATGSAEITSVTTVADVSDSLDGTFFLMQETAGSVAFWIDTDDSGTTIPAGALAADRAVEITTIVTDDADTVVATKVRAAINADAGFSAPAPAGAVITVTNAVEGVVPDASAGDSGFTVAPTSKGSAQIVITDLFEADEPKLPAQHKSTLRRTLQSSLSHRKMANEVADSIEEFQTALNAWMVKLDAESGTLNDTDYVSTLGLDVIDSDGVGSEAQHKSSFRRSMQSALSHKRLADQILDAISGMQGAMNSSLAALDAGSVNGAHAGFKVDPIDPDGR